MKAKFDGICAVTGDSFPAGTEIERHGRGWKRAGAVPRIPVEGERSFSWGSGYGGQPYKKGNVFFEDGNYWRVLTSSREYFRDEGMSFGVGDDSGYIFSCIARPATDEEKAPLIERAAYRQHVKDVKDRIEVLFNSKDGEYIPSEEHIVLNGTVVPYPGDKQNIYGGGQWFVISGEYIWHVENNGMDGDNWSKNNIRTGGAGAIGLRYNSNEARIALLDEICAINSRDSLEK